MKTTDLFKSNRSPKRLNESLEKTFGTKINFEDFDTTKLEDARNKLRTQIHDARSQSGFNETIENETLTKAQWMHDAIVAELAEREEYIVDTTTDENYESMWTDMEEGSENMSIGQQMARDGITYSPEKEKELIGLMSQYMKKAGMSSREIRYYLSYDEDYIPDQLSDLPKEGGDDFDDPDNPKNWGGDHNDQAAYDDRHKEEVEMEGDQDWMKDIKAMAHKMAPQDKMRERQAERDAQAKAERQQKIQKDIDNLPDLIAQYNRMESEYESMGGSNWQYADSEQNLSDEERRARNMETSMRQLANRIHAAKKASEGKKENMNTNEAYINNAKDAIDILADIRAQSKLASRGEAEPVRPNQLVNDLWDVMQWIENNMDEVIETESVENSGENMTKLREGEIQQASAIVTAKTMVDRVGRWIEELSGMENDTLLQLGDSIRDEMGQEQSKAFIQAVAPAIQQALETLKGTRDTLSTGVRSLASGEQPADMLGADPTGMGGDEMAAEPDAMNMGDEMGGEDEFAAAEPAAGGIGDAGREQRESINRSNSLLKALAG
jgi:hypothetical protein